MENPIKPRKIMRLEEYDYTAPGYYFITICTKNRANILGDVCVGAAICRPNFRHTQTGRIVREILTDIPSHYKDVKLDKYIIMPNHIHAILIFKNLENNIGRQIAAPTTTLSNVVGQFKRLCSMRIGDSIWQKGYYDHIIRSDRDYIRIWKYIDENIDKWANDEYYQK